MNPLAKLNSKLDDAAAEFRRKAEARRKGRTRLDPAKRDKNCIEGLKILGERIFAEGDRDFGGKLTKAADELQKLLDAEAVELEAANTPVQEFVKDAQNEAVAELLKKLPKTFPCQFDAFEFVKPLQFSEARHRENREKDARRSHAKKATKIRREFNTKLEAIASESTGAGWANKGIDQLLAFT